MEVENEVPTLAEAESFSSPRTLLKTLGQVPDTDQSLVPTYEPSYEPFQPKGSKNGGGGKAIEVSYSIEAYESQRKPRQRKSVGGTPAKTPISADAGVPKPAPRRSARTPKAVKKD